jgi:hypothetical protein
MRFWNVRVGSCAGWSLLARGPETFQIVHPISVEVPLAEGSN